MIPLSLSDIGDQMGYFWLNKTVRHIICSVRFELRHWRTGYGLEKKSCRVGGHEGSLHGDLLFHSSLVMMHDLINFLAHLLDIETSLLNFLGYTANWEHG